MFITRLKLKNWRNFQEVDLNFSEYTYILGANATGKSNLLDVFKFLRDISKPQGGGLQKALEERGGFNKIRCLHHRQDTEVGIEVHFGKDYENNRSEWIYEIELKQESRGNRIPFIHKEAVTKAGEQILNRPDDADKEDKPRLYQTFLESTQTNKAFREIAHFFEKVSYLHLVPQFLKYADRIGGRQLEGDPYGQGFLASLAHTPEKTRKSRLSKIQKALKNAVPQFEKLEYEQDKLGHPHLKANYAHHRAHGAWQQEEQFSDGTLRLIGILWSLLDSSSSQLLLEEPELSLNNAIIEHIPAIITKIQRKLKAYQRKQIIISTHSEVLLRNKGIDARGVIFLEHTKDGTKARLLNEEELLCIQNGLSIADVVLPKTRPKNSDQLSLAF